MKKKPDNILERINDAWNDFLWMNGDIIRIVAKIIALISLVIAILSLAGAAGSIDYLATIKEPITKADDEVNDIDCNRYRIRNTICDMLKDSVSRLTLVQIVLPDQGIRSFFDTKQIWTKK